MKDEVLERIWKVRDSISAECGYDSRRMVKYLQERTECGVPKGRTQSAVRSVLFADANPALPVAVFLFS